MPPGTPHGFDHPGEQPALILATLTPDLYIEYFHDLAGVGPSKLDPEQVREVRARYATEVAPPAPPGA